MCCCRSSGKQSVCGGGGSLGLRRRVAGGWRGASHGQGMVNIIVCISLKPTAAYYHEHGVILPDRPNSVNLHHSCAPWCIYQPNHCRTFPRRFQGAGIRKPFPPPFIATFLPGHIAFAMPRTCFCCFSTHPFSCVLTEGLLSHSSCTHGGNW